MLLGSRVQVGWVRHGVSVAGSRRCHTISVCGPSRPVVVRAAAVTLPPTAAGSRRSRRPFARSRVRVPQCRQVDHRPRPGLCICRLTTFLRTGKCRGIDQMSRESQGNVGENLVRENCPLPASSLGLRQCLLRSFGFLLPFWKNVSVC